MKGTPVPSDTTQAQSPAAELTVADIQQQAARYLTARFGEGYAYRAPETFGNVVERWIWALAAGSGGLAESCISSIEAHLASPDRREGEETSR
jgi:hypothetical protein